MFHVDDPSCKMPPTTTVSYNPDYPPPLGAPTQHHANVYSIDTTDRTAKVELIEGTPYADVSPEIQREVAIQLCLAQIDTDGYT